MLFYQSADLAEIERQNLSIVCLCALSLWLGTESQCKVGVALEAA